MFYTVILFLVSFSSLAMTINEELLTSKNLNSAQLFIPEKFSDLPKLAKNHELTEANYKECVDFLSQSNRNFYRIKFLSDKFIVEAIVGIPKKQSSTKKYPYIIYNRGGRKDFGKLQACGLLTMNSLFKNDDKYILFAPQLRGTSGSEGTDEYGGQEINDVTNLNNIIVKFPFIDQSNSFMVGWSRGGMTSYLALKNKMHFNAVAILAGLPDLIYVDKVRPDMHRVFNEMIPNIATNRNERLKERSAIYWPESITSPLLILHGAKDVKAPIKPVLEFDQKLSKLNKIHKLVIFPNSGHFFEGAREQLEIEILQWFNKFSK
jgi:dipeptidyl aminopeptidase/acylaminoacyl peptidase